MNAFRALLVIILLAVGIYTVPVVLDQGLTLFAVFFGDIAKMEWPGQFNLDFLGFLTLSAVWTAWRNKFTAPGMALGVMAFFLGAPFLCSYLLYLSFTTDGDVKSMLLGER